MERRLREVADFANRCATASTPSCARIADFSLDATVDPPRNEANAESILQAQDQKCYRLSRRPVADGLLAHQTEGLFFHNNNDLAGGMHE